MPTDTASTDRTASNGQPAAKGTHGNRRAAAVSSPAYQVVPHLGTDRSAPDTIRAEADGTLPNQG